MKKKTLLFILIGVLATCLLAVSLFFVLQGVSAANKQNQYFDVYRARAEEYIKSSPEMIEKYGENITVEFDNSVTYSQSGERGFFDSVIEAFAPRVPDTLEEFEQGIDRIRFNVKVNKKAHEITFEKNDAGELVVSGLKAVK